MGAKRIKVNHNSEFELDLAPLLAVMVKLVPVLLVSSAFVQMMIIETDLPQVVQEAIQRQEDNKEDKPAITIEANLKEGFKIVVFEKGQSKTDNVPMVDGHFDFPNLHQKLIAVKKVYPQIFKIDFKPDGDVVYDDLIRVMDEARKSRNHEKFPVFDSQSGQNVETEYMFPEVVLANTLEG